MQGGLILQILKGGLNGMLDIWLGRRSLDYKRHIARWYGIVTRFKSKLVKMIKDVNDRFDYCFISCNQSSFLTLWL